MGDFFYKKTYKNVKKLFIFCKKKGNLLKNDFFNIIDKGVYYGR